jgi:DNA-binding NarL/FixJ family response regulator
MSAITVVLADDHHVVRQGLRALLGDTEDMQVVGEAGDGLDTLKLVERLRPHVLVLDLMMPGLGGLEITRRLRRLAPDTRVVILSMYADEGYVLQALRNGAAGYVLKGSRAADLLTAIREAAAGRHYLSAPLSERAVEAYVERTRAAATDPYEALTHRERQVFGLAARGWTGAAIARALAISPRTVESHRTSLMRKLGLSGQADLIRFAARRERAAAAATCRPDPLPSPEAGRSPRGR